MKTAFVSSYPGFYNTFMLKKLNLGVRTAKKTTIEILGNFGIKTKFLTSRL